MMTHGSKDYHQILGVPYDADEKTIKEAFKKAAFKYHPDRNQGDKAAEEKFKEVSEAYEQLTNPKQFNKTGPFTTVDFTQDIFSQFFGVRRPVEDIHMKVRVSFMEAYVGCNKLIKYRVSQDCKDCNGSGSSTNKFQICPFCKGASSKFPYPFAQCRQCNSKGYVPKNICPKCSGAGVMQLDKELSVTIPRGADSGMQLRLSKMGSCRGKFYSDLYLDLDVEPPPHGMVRNGVNLLSRLEVTIPDAVLGFVKEIQTVEGPKQINVTPGIKPGATVRLTGMGMPVIHSDKRGDHIVNIEMKIPTTLNAEQRSLFERLRQLL